MFKSLMIELTNKCNLSCPFCLTGKGGDLRKKGEMTFLKFKKIVNSRLDLRQILLWGGMGEPFLASDIIKIINYASEKILYLDIHTNGMALNKEKINNLNIKNKLEITFSIDGVNQKVYEAYRRDGDLKKVLKNLSYLVNFKKEKDLSNLEIVWQFLVNKKNEGQIRQVVKTAKNIGVDKLKLKTISINKKDPRYSEFIPRNVNYRREDKYILKEEECYFINPGMPVILHNGDILPCCDIIPPYLKGNSEYLMGNAFKENIENVWKSKKYCNFMNLYKKKKNKFCLNNCRRNNKSKIYIKEFKFN